MFKRVKKWCQNFKADATKSRGLAEKAVATQRKIEVAMKILDRRHEEIPVSIERRHPEDENLRKRWEEICWATREL